LFREMGFIMNKRNISVTFFIALLSSLITPSIEAVPALRISVPYAVYRNLITDLPTILKTAVACGVVYKGGSVINEEIGASDKIIKEAKAFASDVRKKQAEAAAIKAVCSGLQTVAAHGRQARKEALQAEAMFDGFKTLVSQGREIQKDAATTMIQGFKNLADKGRQVQTEQKAVETVFAGMNGLIQTGYERALAQADKYLKATERDILFAKWMLGTVATAYVLYNAYNYFTAPVTKKVDVDHTPVLDVDDLVDTIA